MENRSIIVIGASSGGVEALKELFRRIDPNLNASVFIVLHFPTDVKSFLPNILRRAGTLPVAHAVDGEKIEPGRAYIAPPNHHLIIQDGTVHLMFGPKENGFRPAIDPLFQSAAQAHGPDVIGVILSGNLYDGTRGLLAVKRAGGLAIAQDPEEALYPGMPSNAIQFASVDYTLPISEIAHLLNRLTQESVPQKGENEVQSQTPDLSGNETNFIREDIEAFEKDPGSNQRSVLTCPDCGGVLWELKDEGLVRYRCHVGHIYNPDALQASQNGQVENAFWTAIRVLVEKAALANRLAQRAKENGNEELVEHYLAQARQAEKDADIIRSTWLHGMANTSKSSSSGEQANEEVSGDLSQDVD